MMKLFVLLFASAVLGDDVTVTTPPATTSPTPTAIVAVPAEDTAGGVVESKDAGGLILTIVGAVVFVGFPLLLAGYFGIALFIYSKDGGNVREREVVDKKQAERAPLREAQTIEEIIYDDDEDDE